jgi:antitoxin (DNA-binding transcriptional repressor) of toxin-antitoxin stability system
MQQRVAIRELRRRSRYYLARVVAGEHFEVTVFGRPIADLGPLDGRPLIEADFLTDDDETFEAEHSAPVTMRINSALNSSDEVRVIRVRDA